MISKSRVSVSPIPVEILWWNPTGLQGQIPWGFLVPLSDPQSGKPDEGFRTFTTVQDCFGIVLQPVGHPPSGYAIWFYHDYAPPTISLQLLLCLWMWGVSFRWVPASCCRWLFNSQFQFWCSHRRRWAHTLLLHHLEPDLNVEFSVFFIKTIFWSSFKFTAKLRGRYSYFLYIPCPRTCIASLIINISCLSGIFDGID